MKKTIATLLTAVMVLSCSIPVFAATGAEALPESGPPEQTAGYAITLLEDSEFYNEIVGSGSEQQSVSEAPADGETTSGQTDGEESAPEAETSSVPQASPAATPAARAAAAASTPVVSSSTTSTPPATQASPQAATTKATAPKAAKTYVGLNGYVERLYDIVLGRAGSAGEIQNHVSALQSGGSAGQLAYDFFNSDEFTTKGYSDNDYIYILYRAVLNREPGASEVSFYRGVLDSASRNQVLRDFVDSAEFHNLCAGYGVDPGSITITNFMDLNAGTARFVQRLYRLTLGREGANSEVEAHTKAVVEGGTNAAQLAYEFFNSAEFKGRNLTNTQYVEILYNTILDRASEPGGLKHHVNTLDEGASRNYVLSGFVTSDEFNALCGKYGIRNGALSTTDPYDLNGDAARFVTRMYLNVLGRTKAPGEDEARGHVNWIVSGPGSAQFTVDCFLSAEFINRNLSDADYISALYKGIMGRTPGADEIKYYKDWLDQGASRNFLLSTFLTSEEFQKLIASYGVKFGSYSLPNVVGPNSGTTNNFTGFENGIDVSAHQGSINWSAVKAAGYDFAIIRATTYSSKKPVVDPYFYENVRGAKKAGIKVGAYVYTYSYSTSGVQGELNALFGALNTIEREGYRLDYPVFWDVEANDYTNQASKSGLTDLCIYAIDSMRANGYFGALYTYTNFANTRLDMGRLSHYDFWVAQYGPRVTYGGSYTMWQYTSKGYIGNMRVDLNYSYKDYESEIKNGGWNHW